MAYRHERRRVRSVLAVTAMVAATFLSGGLPPRAGQAEAAGVPRHSLKGFLKS